jgi:methylated-DNA-[protein]-cysteine S-methyltransferase
VKGTAYCLFETPLGVCGIGWRDGEQPAVCLFQLPEATPVKTEARIARKAGVAGPDAPPPFVADLIDRVRRHLGGEPQDFRDAPLDLGECTAFTRRVYETARNVLAGQTVSYGELARLAGRPGAARAVGQVMRKNPLALLIPCHRVLAAGGKPGGYSAHGKLQTKAALLALEGSAFGRAGA